MEELSGKKICILAGQGFEDMELMYPLFRLRYEACANVQVVGMKKGDRLVGEHGMPVTVDVSLDEASPGDYDALVIPGGYSPDKLRLNPEPVKFVQEFAETGRPIAAICHGPQLLITAKLLDGLDATGWQSIRVDLENAGAHYHDKPLVASKQYIFSRKPEDCGYFCDAIMRALSGPAEKPDAQMARAV
jgi:protease I